MVMQGPAEEGVDDGLTNGASNKEKQGPKEDMDKKDQYRKELKKRSLEKDRQPVRKGS